MIGIVDSGSTKTDWCLVDHSGEKRVRTAGMNPYFQSEEEMAETLRTQLLPALEEMKAEPMEAIYFYGAGCATETVNQKVEQAIRRFFPDCSKSISKSRSPAVGLTETTVPFPNALCCSCIPGR